jgi:uncharacterized protein YdeI (YjbR/CyaY-like superfamily)
MAPVVPHPKHLRAFPNAKAFEAWLSAHHDKDTELWLKIHKKDSGLPTVTYAEALDVALCWGWIDGQKKGFDAQSFLQRFTPRKGKSLWSANNREHVARLIQAGRMTPHGLKHVEAAKADGRWDKAYEGAAKMPFPDDLLAAIEAEPRAQDLFQQLNATNRYALAFRTHNAKTEATRRKRIEAFVQMLKRGETPYPNGSGATKKPGKRAP